MPGHGGGFREIPGRVQNHSGIDELEQHFARSPVVDFEVVSAGGVEDADAVLLIGQRLISTNIAPQWNPAPKAAKQIRSPGHGPCACHHSDAAINMDADEVLP